MNAQLSRRVGRLMDVAPIVWMLPDASVDFARAVTKAGAFEDLPGEYQRLILEAEANLVRLIAEHESGPKIAAG
jgi:hypothetical protein